MHLTPLRLAISAAILIVAANGFAAWVLWTTHRANCEARNVTLTVMRDILMDAQRSTDTNPKTTVAQRSSSDAFVAYELARIHSALC